MFGKISCAPNHILTSFADRWQVNEVPASFPLILRKKQLP